jgi:tetratricopeptide (TPR) repeat protein
MEAARYLQTAMKTPTALVYQVTSRMLIDLHEHEEAITKAQRAITFDPNDADGYLAMAYALIHAGRPEEALDFVKTAMRLDPNYPAYYLFVVGLAHFNMERFEDAANSFKRALKHNPINYLPLIHLAAAYAYLDLKQEAAAAIQELNKALPIVSVGFVKHPTMSRYKDPVDKDRLIDGLRKAGLSESPYHVLYKAGEK